MNLIQVQERLKDLPLQAIMAYANGVNPDVPPYLALGEMQRRKRVEQEAQPAEPPTGTVKDQLEQQAGLAALQQMQQQQAQQQMMQGAAQQPMPVPEGAPQPEMQPEMSGIANAAAQPGGMQPGVMGMAGGGIVAFAKAGDVDEDEDEDDEDEEEAGAGYGGADTYAVADRPALNARDLEMLDRLGVTPITPPQAAPSATPVTRSLQPQAPQAPQAAQSTLQKLDQAQQQAAQQRAAMPQAPQMPTRESMARENPAMYGVLNKPAGQGYLAGLEALMAKQAAEDPRALEQLERNKRMDFYKALIAAGEGTRGQKGLGGLLGGFGKAAIPAMEARAQEEANILGQALKRDELLNKAKFDVEKLQRAQGEGDLKAEQKSKQDLFKSAVELYRSGNASLAREIGALAGIREAEIRAAASERAAQIRAAAKGQGGGEGKPTDLDKQYKIELDALIADGAPNDAATRKAAMNIAQAQISKSAGTYRAETTAQQQADAWVQMQLLTGPRARELRALRSKDPAAYKKELEALEAEAQRKFVRPSPTRNPPSTAQRGTKDNPIKLD